MVALPAPGRTRPQPPGSSRLERWVAARLRGFHPSVAALLVGATGALVLSVVLSAAGLALVSLGPVTGLDHRVGDVVGQTRTAGWTAVAETLTRATEAWTVLGVVLGAGVVLALTARWRPLTVLLVAVQVELAVLLAVSAVVDRPRPDDLVGVEPFTASFPSGHAAMAVALYGSLAVVAAALAPGRRVAPVTAVAAGVIAAVVSASRIVLGLHHLSDVLAGLALGGASLGVGVLAARTLPLDPAPDAGTVAVRAGSGAS